jgi:hypothetical protein
MTGPMLIADCVVADARPRWRAERTPISSGLPTYFWVTPAEDLAVLVLTQILSPGAYPFKAQLRATIYPAIIDLRISPNSKGESPKQHQHFSPRKPYTAFRSDCLSQGPDGRTSPRPGRAS